MPQFKALLIANWDYVEGDPTLKPLRGPRHNLVELKKALCDPQFGLFGLDDVQTLENLTVVPMSEAFGAFTDNARPGDHLFIYYTGHGVRLADTKELGLCGVDATAETLTSRCFRASNLKTWIKDARATSQVVVLDCCYSGAYTMGPDNMDVADLDRSFGSGVGVLSSGALEPVPDASEDQPTPFTKALIKIMLDEEIRPPDFLSLDEAYAELQQYQPKLKPQPVHNPGPRGGLPLAKRAPRQMEAPTLKGWTDWQFEDVDIRFRPDQMDLTVNREKREVALSRLDATRRAALRRLPQLVDAVVRTRQYGDDSWDRVVRKAWECVGTTLFDALPEDVRQLVMDADARPNGPVLRLRVGCDDDPLSRYNELLPWEYLLPPELDEDMPPRPLGLRDNVVIERTCGRPIGRPGVSADVRPPGAAHSPLEPTNRMRASATTPRQTVAPDLTSPADTNQLAFVGLVNGLPREFHGLGKRLGEEITAMHGTSLIFELGNTAERANWASFADAMEANPHHLVLMLPVERLIQLVRFGFDSDGTTRDWRPVSAVSGRMENRSNLRTITLVTVAAEPGRDCYRGLAAAAQTLAARLSSSVVFICHQPTFAAHSDPPGDAQPHTFVGLLISALAHGKPLDESFCYARKRSTTVYMEDRLVPAFGVPGYYSQGLGAVRTRASDSGLGGGSP